MVMHNQLLNPGTSTSILTTGERIQMVCIHCLLQQVNFLSTDFMAVATDPTVSSAALMVVLTL